MRSEKVSKPFQGTGLYVGMSSAFSFAETVDFVMCTLRVANDARETLLAAEPEVFVGDDSGESEKVLDVRENAGGIGDESLAADEVQLVGAELCQPAAHVDGVQSYLYGSPRRVHSCRVTAVGVGER